mmetsp:Transcript_2505/g.7347  ORF Transcript_2505/g.7347 Transcript_2505/m.7347 type:complete len:223 (-) Transcript_2505:42-710(-)|eukprot:CAMPEP_0119290272 /NCGR_PEP_ID=MMETSP1329-20130426/40425_1 /TAXON_ID=114041 /ORGANISM="Genus nov. species nov., Strain RCC1024" /LENGTH=222 /DNA_ID=CAMNT_0007291089 /DNA_START=180 /DNA_END=848 /DNA_ORIENTATION=+
MFSKLVIASAVASAAAATAAQKDSLVLESFDGSVAWTETNDPVMGGQSTATFEVTSGSGVFNGTCAIVPSLSAPGFCSAATPKTKLKPSYPDVSGYAGLAITATTSTPNYAGYKVAFSALGVPKASVYGAATFKAPFNMSGTAQETVFVPFNTFSWDWSPYTGECDTKDPTGQQHHCCGEGDAAQYCPTADHLASLTGLELWAEGAEGVFTIEFASVSAANA